MCADVIGWVFGVAAAAKGPPICALLMGPNFNEPLFPPNRRTQGGCLPHIQQGQRRCGGLTLCPITWQEIHPSH